MGLMNNVLGIGQVVGSIGQAVKSTSEVFKANQTEAMRLDEQRFSASVTQYANEFNGQPVGAFAHFVNGLNRLPRPLLAFGTIGLFIYAMVDPLGFSERMIGLNTVPEPLWWLLGAIVGFYFGARELYYMRNQDFRQVVKPSKIQSMLEKRAQSSATESPKERSFSKVKAKRNINTKNPAILAWLETVS